MEWGHGGDVMGYALEYGKKPLDFSANVSPFGMPEGVKQAVTESLDDSHLALAIPAACCL